jgi:hypothetical protein
MISLPSLTEANDPQLLTIIIILLYEGDWTSQKYLGSMEGAGNMLSGYALFHLIISYPSHLTVNIATVLAGKLAAEVVTDRAAGVPYKPQKEIDASILKKAEQGNHACFTPNDQCDHHCN